MIFSELYSVYYNVVAKIISEITEGNTDERELNRIVCDNAFGESVLTVLPSLKSEKWQLVRSDMTTFVKHKPTMPLTLIQKRWLKAISLDPRVRLFDVSFEGLEGVDPLFTPEDYVIYDKYCDGDPFTDEDYIARFRLVLQAIREKRSLKIEALNRRGNVILMRVLPICLEYSEKDDKFRLITAGCRYGGTVNLARIVSCKPCEGNADALPRIEPVKQETVTLRISNERNALERCMLHFAHFKKQAEKIDSRNYLVHIQYDKDDETEMVIRILGFGPLVEVMEPVSFRNLIIERLKSQKSCELF